MTYLSDLAELGSTDWKCNGKAIRTVLINFSRPSGKLWAIVEPGIRGWQPPPHTLIFGATNRACYEGLGLVRSGRPLRRPGPPAQHGGRRPSAQTKRSWRDVVARDAQQATAEPEGEDGWITVRRKGRKPHQHSWRLAATTPRSPTTRRLPLKEERGMARRTVLLSAWGWGTGNPSVRVQLAAFCAGFPGTSLAAVRRADVQPRRPRIRANIIAGYMLT
uniref:Uncharacterized protein n=1 Tax=Oryza brachyantha TaxID=4533 RepID=J3MR64_ORYBR